MMEWVYLLKLQLLKFNLIIFLLFSLVITLVAENLPKNFYLYKKWLFKERNWEKSGRIYEKYFFVKKWKCRLPEISDFIKSRFAKKHMKNNSKEYLSAFLTESCKSELTHWLIILSSLLLLFWNDIISTFLIFIVSIALNLPYIIIQRYNRPRIIKLLNKTDLHQIELIPSKIHA